MVMNELTKITINNKELEVPSHYTILQAASEHHIFIPRLCFLKDLNENSSCRLCVVEIEGIKTLKNSCTVKVTDGMIIKTNTPRIRNTVKQTLELLAANHRFECWICPREHNCEFLALLRKYGIPNQMAESKEFVKKLPIMNDNSDAIQFDGSKCILCGRCVAACEKLAGTGVLDFNERGFVTFVGTAQNYSIEDSGCIYCGKCIQVCPTGAIREKEELDIVEELLQNDEFYLVAQTAPSVRCALGEEFGLPIGTNVEGKMYHSLKLLGFDDITDTNFAADLTIMEEGSEFLGRFQKLLNQQPSALPMFSSCSPGWIRYIERYYPEYIPNLSSCKSPQQMQGAIIKHYYAKKIGVPKEKIKVVSIMPCIAKKYEAKRPEMQYDGVRDVDYVLTTRELARLIKRADINFTEIEDYQPKSPLAQYTGAAVIFGATGGVMEAALRTVVEKLEGIPLPKIEFEATRGVDTGIKEATVRIAGIDVNIAVIHGTANVPEMMTRIKKGEKQYHFIEVMACTGGCVNGGGQPIIPAHIAEKIDVRKERAKALYAIDDDKQMRSSHTNPEIVTLYQEFLHEPNSKVSHHLLHTHYQQKPYFFMK
jgi:NADP-reducing hydrogenase subunit HndD